jgi:hypothetical protein
VDANELVVAYATGSGFKTQEALNGSLIKPIMIEPHFAEFEKVIQA